MLLSATVEAPQTVPSHFPGATLFLTSSPQEGGCDSQYWTCLTGIYRSPCQLSQLHHSLKDDMKHPLHPRFLKYLADTITHQEIPVRSRTHAILLVETEKELLQQTCIDICLQAFSLGSIHSNKSIFCLIQGQVIFIRLKHFTQAVYGQIP